MRNPAGIVLLMLSAATLKPSHAHAEYKAAEFFRDCTVATKTASGEIQTTANNFANALHCIGFIEASALSARKTHELYGFAFPGLKQSDLSNETTAKRFFAAAILAGLDVCIPNETTLQTLASIVVNHLKANPKDLSSTPLQITNMAWAATYPCQLP